MQIFFSSVFLECLMIFLIIKVKVATSLVGLEGGVEGAVVLTDWAAQRAAGGRVSGHLQQVGPRRVVRVYLGRRWQFLSFWKLDTFAREDKAAQRGAGLSEQEVAILIIGNLAHLHLRTKPRRVVRIYLRRRWQFLSFRKLATFTLEDTRKVK